MFYAHKRTIVKLIFCTSFLLEKPRARGAEMSR